MRQAIPAIAALVLFCVPVFGQSSPGQGQLLGPGGRAFVLKHTEVSADVAGPVARVLVRQVFENPFQEPIEALYVFPLPDRAAVDDMTIEIGARRIRGEIRLRQEAQRIYDEARQKGKTAALLTQERANVFTQHLANIRPGETIVVEIRYVERLAYEKGTYTLVFPMVVGPRFHPPGEVPDAAAVPGRPEEYLRPDERCGHDITLAAALDAGVPIADVASPSHDVEWTRTGPGVAAVKLAASDTIPNKDFVLTWKVGGDEPRGALLAHRTDGDGHFALMIQPEEEPPSSVVVPREVILVVDCSGSMRGMPIETAKAVVRRTLETLSPWDTFQILKFSQSASGLSPTSLPATPDNVRQGLAYIDAMHGSGGTMMIEGIRAALLGPRDAGRLRVVHFLTDGFIGNELQILDEVRRLRSGARLFPMGIGSSPNRFLIDRLAKVGCGAAAYVRQGASQERIEEAVTQFVERVRRPTFTELEIDWDGLPVKEVTPLELPDLFAGQPIVVHGVYTQPAEGTVRLRGWRGSAPYELAVPVVLPLREERHDALPQLWARARIADLVLQPARDSREIEDAITDLALRFHLMSDHTAFVAVEEQIVTSGGAPRVVRQPLPLPEGSSWGGFFGTDHNEDCEEEWEESKGAADKPFDAGQINDAIGLGGGAGGAVGGRGGKRQLRAGGGAGNVTQACQRGIQWLPAHQSPDGRWDADGFMAQDDPAKGAPCDGAARGTSDVTVTGLALLTFLGAGVTHREGSYKESVRSGLRWLKAQQGEGGAVGDPQDLEGHAIAALTLAEAYGTTKSGIWKGAAQAAVDRVLDLQVPGRGWGAGPTGPGTDIVLTGWMVAALRSATTAGLDVPPRALKDALRLVEEMTDAQTGRVGAVDPTGSELRTAAGILIRIFAGQDPQRTPVIAKGAALCAQRAPLREEGRIDLLEWTFGCLAMFQVGGDPWRVWNAAMKGAIIDPQRQDGNFQGSWDPVGPGAAAGGRVWSTALMTLCGEVYYRYTGVFGIR